LGKEEAPASHLIDAYGSWQVLRELFVYLLMFRKVWVYSSALFLFVYLRNSIYKKFYTCRFQLGCQIVR